MMKILFIGNFLSKHSGTKGAVEKLAPTFKSIEVDPKLVSSIQNKYLRLAHMIFASLFSKYKVIHIDLYSGAAFKYAELCSKIGKFRKKKVVLNLRGGMLIEVYERNPERVNKLFNTCSLIITPSLFLQEYFNAHNFNTHYLPNGFDFSNFPYNRDNVISNSLLWVRAFNDIYSPEVAIETLKRVHEKHPDARLTMIGPNKGKRADVEKLIEKYQLEKFVEITGPQPNNELYKYYQTHQAFLNTTQYESFGNCIAEAASCGIPIVSNKVGEVPYLWEHGKNSFLVENNSPEEFAKCCIDLFDNSKLSNSISKSAKEHIEQFNTSSILIRWKDLLSNLK